MTLTRTEFDLLYKIAKEIGADCWFSIVQDKNGNDYVYDREEKKRMSLRKGIKILLEGVTSYDLIMKPFEKSAIIDLLIALL